MVPVSALMSGFMEYWLTLRDARVAPDADQIRVEEFGECVPLLIWMNRHSEGDFRVRFCGSGVSDVLGYDLKGTNVLDLKSEERVSRSEQYLEAVCSQPCGVYSVLTMSTKAQLLRRFEVLYLPLARNERVEDILEIACPLDIDFRVNDFDEGYKFVAAEPPIFVDVGGGVPEKVGPFAESSSQTLVPGDIFKGTQTK